MVANRRVRDVAAGVAILLEAGGLVTTANPPEDIDGPIEPVKLGSRLYLAIRYAPYFSLSK
jgi:myo-inositol-1(or 4)-monophosphatase